jgi:hypothetical protein
MHQAKSSNVVIEQLFDSMNSLGGAIKSAREKLMYRKGGVSKEVLERLDSYDSILLKQRTLAFQLCQQLQVGNGDEIERLVALINGLSRFVCDDVREVLGSLRIAQSGQAEHGIDGADSKNGKFFVC